MSEDEWHTSAIAGASQTAEIATVAVDAVPLEARRDEAVQVERLLSGTVTQREAELTGRFQQTSNRMIAW